MFVVVCCCLLMFQTSRIEISETMSRRDFRFGPKCSLDIVDLKFIVNGGKWGSSLKWGKRGSLPLIVCIDISKKSWVQTYKEYRCAYFSAKDFIPGIIIFFL